ncbi:hypothetical protein NOF04DRAFT_11156 [Fusarium oxysporum II5]|uniref:Uncharacterized protein n=2 Tax=Fusarium oxysporum species complex TaxID=171631 RepID=X0KDI5_FUSO5|nr:uncharacterized protein FOIG_12435 [Fusarium odoratissimum NRRL 54006]EXL94994.1 hypothetical protein FOIG_12435 [Fusarium odoratissimum NRRL 54006]KAK2135866.1 hypothetical protein NOF04DRAFT_11156 [Fusarium oxysporum II5]TXC11779.1 hypothetical protein FocTR4_00006166 [Fusarium oxysporum f. sp. cubense]
MQSAEYQEYRQPVVPAVASTQDAGDRNAFRLSVTSSDHAGNHGPATRPGNASVFSYGDRADDLSILSDPMGYRNLTTHFQGRSTQKDQMRAKLGLADRRSEASGKRPPKSSQCRDNNPSITAQDSSDPFVFSSGLREEEQFHTEDPFPLRFTNRETLECYQPVTPSNAFAQQPSGLQQLPVGEPDEPSWFWQFRRQCFSDQKEMRQRMANGVTKSFTGLSSQSVQGSIEPLSNSVIQRAETMASHHTQTTGRTEKIDQAGATVQNLREIKKVLAEIAATNREQLDAFQKERAEILVAADHHWAPGGYR